MRKRNVGFDCARFLKSSLRPLLEMVLLIQMMVVFVSGNLRRLRSGECVANVLMTSSRHLRQ